MEGGHKGAHTHTHTHTHTHRDTRTHLHDTLITSNTYKAPETWVRHAWLYHHTEGCQHALHAIAADKKHMLIIFLSPVHLGRRYRRLVGDSEPCDDSLLRDNKQMLLIFLFETHLGRRYRRLVEDLVPCDNSLLLVCAAIERMEFVGRVTEGRVHSFNAYYISLASSFEKTIQETGR